MSAWLFRIPHSCTLLRCIAPSSVVCRSVCRSGLGGGLTINIFSSSYRANADTSPYIVASATTSGIDHGKYSAISCSENVLEYAGTESVHKSGQEVMEEAVVVVEGEEQLQLRQILHLQAVTMIRMY